MLNSFKNRSKNTKSSNRLNLTPRSASTVVESFDSTKGKEKSTYTPPPPSANLSQSTPGDSYRKPAVSSSATPLSNKASTPAPVAVLSPVASKVEISPFHTEPPFEPQPIIPEPEPELTEEVTTASYTQNAFDAFRRSDSRTAKPVNNSKPVVTPATKPELKPVPEKTVKMYKPIPEPKTQAPTVKPKDMPKAPAKQLIVGSGVMVNADITQADVVLIEGTVKGTIFADCLMILDGGIFEGEATCRVAYIAGVFSGPKLITSEKLQVGSTGKITASISYNVISMEAGSVVTGMLTHVPPPVPEPEPEPEPEPVVEELPTVQEEGVEETLEETKLGEPEAPGPDKEMNLTAVQPIPLS